MLRICVMQLSTHKNSIQTACSKPERIS